MRYQEYPPPRHLASSVHCIWVFENQTRADLQDTLVADGYPELILHSGPPCLERNEVGRLAVQSATVISGQLTRPLELHTPAAASMVGIRFRPWGLARFIQAPMHDLTNLRVDGHDVLPGLAELMDALNVAFNDTRRLDVCYRFLSRFNNCSKDLTARRAVESIERTGGCQRVAQLAATVGVSRRKLELAFAEEIGVSPKQFSRIVRFRQVMERLSDSNGQSLVQLALDAGFFDQPHMIRDFKQFSGHPPGTTAKELAVRPGHQSDTDG